jgi:hypothetical protein
MADENRETPKAASQPPHSKTLRDSDAVWSHAAASWTAVAEGHGASLPRRHRFRQHPRRTRTGRPRKAASQPPHSKTLRDSDAVWSFAAASWSAVAEGHGASLPRRHRFRQHPRRTRTGRPRKAASKPPHSKTLRDFLQPQIMSMETRISRGLAPSPGPMMPRISRMSIMRAARP